MTPALALLAVSIALRPDLAAKNFAATALETFRAPEGGAAEARLDVAGLEIKSVEKDGALVPFDVRGGQLTVRLPSPLASGATAELRIEYAGRRRGSGLVFTEDGFWSRGEHEGGGRWFPFPVDPDARVVSNVSVAVSSGVTVVTNGVAEPHPARLISVYGGRFARHDEAVAAEGRVVVLASYVPKGREADAQAAFARVPEMLSFFARTFKAPFPWSGYSQTVVRDPLDDGLENTAAARFDEAVLRGDEELVAHELVHQWFGSFVSHRGRAAEWLDEGAASWFASVWLGRSAPDELSWSLSEKARAVFAAAPRPLASAGPLDAAFYGRAAWFYRMLNAQLGDAAFAEALRRYLAAGRAADGDDLRRAAEAASGRDLEDFFGQWTRRAGHPRLRLTLSYDADAKSLALRASARKPADGGPPFKFRLPLRLDDGTSLAADFSTDVATFSWARATRPRWVAVDPDLTVLVEIERTWPEELLRAELASGPTAASRARAAGDLAESGSPEAVAALRDCLRREPSWGVAAACARALGRGAGADALAALAAGTGRPEPKARRAVASALGGFSGRGAEAGRALAALAGDADEDVAAEAVRALGRRKSAGARAALLAALASSSRGETLRRGALEGLGALGDPAALPDVVEQAAPGRPPRVRAAALAAWAALGGDEAGRKAACAAVLRDEDDLWARRACGDPPSRFLDEKRP